MAKDFALSFDLTAQTKLWRIALLWPSTHLSGKHRNCFTTANVRYFTWPGWYTLKTHVRLWNSDHFGGLKFPAIFASSSHACAVSKTGLKQLEVLYKLSLCQVHIIPVKLLLQVSMFDPFVMSFFKPAVAISKLKFGMKIFSASLPFLHSLEMFDPLPKVKSYL